MNEHNKRLKERFATAAKEAPYEAINFLRLHQYHFISQEAKRLLREREKFQKFASNTTAQLQSSKGKEEADQGDVLNPENISTSALPTGTGDDSDQDTTDDDRNTEGETARK